MPKEVTGIVVFPGGTYERRVFTQLADYQSAVEGLIEIIHLYDHTYDKAVATMYVDEEGRLKERPRINAVASGISFLLNNESTLYGNAIIVGAGDGEGYDTDIPDWLLNFVDQVAKDVTHV
jgi:hypothetical protein